MSKKGTLIEENEVVEYTVKEPKLDKNLKEPCFIKICDLKPGTKGLNISAIVVEINVIVEKIKNDGQRIRICDCTIGDETGIINFTAKNEQLNLLKKNEKIVIRNGKIDLFKQCMRLLVDDYWGTIQNIEEATSLVTCEIPKPKFIKKEKNVSLQKYEVIYGYK
eukprot:gene9888-2210_t